MNKRHLQRALGLIQDDSALLFFWSSRLDPIQKGCQLLAEAFYGILSTCWDHSLQVVFVANGDYQQVFRNILNQHGFHDWVAVCDFNEDLEHQAYAAADFLLMPSKFEPCGLPQMIAPIYGALPVAHDTGGIHDHPSRCGPGHRQRLSVGKLRYRCALLGRNPGHGFFQLGRSRQAAPDRAVHAGECGDLQPCQHSPALYRPV